MPAVDSSFALALVAALMLLLLASHRRRISGRRAKKIAESASTRFVAQAVRVLTVAERQAHTLLRQAMPGYLVLAQVPVTRFLRVDPSQPQWVQQTNGLSADLLLCDSGSRVLAVVSVRSVLASEGSRRRHDKLMRLLRDSGVKSLFWNEDALPDVAMIRAQIVPMLVGNAATRPPGAVPSRAMPLIPVAEILAEGDAEHDDASMEPVPSALFDEFEPDLPLPNTR